MNKTIGNKKPSYPLSSNERFFVVMVEQKLQEGVKQTRLALEKRATDYGIRDKSVIKELTELAIVNRARQLAFSDKSPFEKYLDIVALYNQQANISFRTSQSILLQQYSTPAPIGYLMGEYCAVQYFSGKETAFEPSAGNGLLTVAGRPNDFYVNEVDAMRSLTLQTQGYKVVTQQDASLPFTEYYKKFDAVITNPPFGTLSQAVKYDGFPIKTLDHLMALRALDCMKDNGKAAIIIGGHTQWDEKGRIQAGKNRIFFNYLYSHYNVEEVLLLNGKKLYARQGTAFNVRLLLINGRKINPNGVAPVKNPKRDIPINSFEELWDRVSYLLSPTPSQPMKSLVQLEKEAQKLLDSLADLGAPYLPASEQGKSLNTQVPDSMSFETHDAIQYIKSEVGGDMDNFVRHRLGYRTKAELYKALAAEQIDAVALSIYNIEARGQGIIDGDQTGIGKGRVAAAMIRYGVLKGLKPIFLTEKPNLFSDLYRDLFAIGSGHLKPFIVNGKEGKTDVKDEEGNVVYQALPITEQTDIFKSRKVPQRFDFVMATYSQFNSPDKKPEKPGFLNAIAENNIMVLDEAHNASGSSNTGEFLQSVVAKAGGVIFLSATFAKRPDNMPIYAMKTAISEANMTKEELVNAIVKGGVALQEVLASQLVAEGQMIRRERSFEGVEVNYISLDQLEQEHRAVADNITDILREIIKFQSTHIDAQVEELDKIAVAEGKEVQVREGTSQAGVDNQPYFSKVFNVINQMLFSIKAIAVADRAIIRLKEGKKPVIAFASTMGSFIEQMEDEHGMGIQDGSIINTDFSEVLIRGLTGIMKYTEKDVNGEANYKTFDITSLPPEAQADYYRIVEKIKSVSTGISISPIDIIIQRLENAGYKVAEVTGRKYGVQINPKTGIGMVKSRKKLNTNDAFRQFNNNEVDVLMINQSGSTGASAHAIKTPKVPPSEVKQRVMIVLQAELDINREVQKRGRINRTGQLLLPIYDYLISAIPAEKRLMMMLQKKLKSLDANTTSNQKQSTKILDVPDFLNKYGDRIMVEYLKENLELNELLGDPINVAGTKGDEIQKEEAAHKVSGRVAVLSTQMQQDFYNEISERYDDLVEYLKQTGEYDLEVETLNLQAVTTSTKSIKIGKGGDSAFGEDSVLETITANVLKKPFNRVELENLINLALAGNEPEQMQLKELSDYNSFMTGWKKQQQDELESKYTALFDNLANEKKLKDLQAKGKQSQYEELLKERRNEITKARADAFTKLEKDYYNRNSYLSNIFNFFYPSRVVNYTYVSYDGGIETVFAVCLGFMIDRKKKNPYAPSAIKVKFAIANGNKYIAMPASYSEELLGIIGASNNVRRYNLPQLLDNWENEIRKNQGDRQTRYVITGNLLQAYSDFHGKLVSYTTMEGETKKGILMPENWLPENTVKDRVTVPIIKAVNIIKTLSPGAGIFTNNDLAFFNERGRFKIVVQASNSRGGKYYLDQDILALVDNRRFEKVADKMVAYTDEENMTELVEVLQRNHSLSITVSEFQMDLLVDTKIRYSIKRKIELPSKEEPINNLKILELEAEALILKLRFLQAA